MFHVQFLFYSKKVMNNLETFLRIHQIGLFGQFLCTITTKRFVHAHLKLTVISNEVKAKKND